MSRKPEFYLSLGFVLYCIGIPSGLAGDKEGGRGRNTEGQSSRWVTVAPSDALGEGSPAGDRNLSSVVSGLPVILSR